MKKKLLAVMFGATLVLGACGGGNDDKNDNANGNGDATATVDAEKIVNNSCVSCHGGNLEGRGNAPALADVGSRLSEQEIHDIIKNGQGGMPGNLIKDEDELAAVSKWLSEKK